MISNINDVLIFLNALSKFKKRHGIRKKMLHHFIKIDPSLVTYPFDYDDIFKFGLDLHLYEERNNAVTLTNHGYNIIAMSLSQLDLTEEQKEYMVKHCIFGNKQFSKVQQLLAKFIFQDQFSSFVIIHDKTFPYIHEIMILSQFGVLRNDKRLWIVNQDYIEYVEQIKQGSDKLMTKDQLEAILDEQKRIGELAEDLTVKYEILRLKKQRLTYQSKRVQKISTKYVNKGYDIESFSSKDIKPNLFIEVKARKYNLSSFIISINEIQTAMKLKNKYAIYFWNNVGAKSPPKKPFKIIQNPFKKLALGECANCLNFLIEL